MNFLNSDFSGADVSTRHAVVGHSGQRQFAQIAVFHARTD